MTEDKLVMLRGRGDYRDRLVTLANKRNQTLTAITNEALNKFLINEEYTFEDLLEAIDEIPSLKLSIEKIKEEIKNCPPVMCKQIIETIKNKEVFLFEENFDTVESRIKNIDKENLDGVFIHMTIKDNEINKINETLKKITGLIESKKIKFGAGAKNNNHENILLFVAYNKKESMENGKKSIL